MLSCGYVPAIAVPPSQVALNMASDSHLQFGVVGEEIDNRPPERTVVLDARIVPV